MHLKCAKIFLKVFSALGAGNRKDVVAFSEKPGQGQLAWGAAFLAGKEFDTRDEIEGESAPAIASAPGTSTRPAPWSSRL